MPENHQRVIDVHTHLFNLEYLPLWGILKSHGVPEIPAKLIEVILLKLTKTAFNPSLSFKINASVDISNYPLEFSKLKDEVLVEQMVNFACTDQDLLHHDLLIPALNCYPEFLQNLDSQNELINTEFDLESKRFGLAWLIRKALSGFAYLRWFLFMTKNEYKLLSTMFKNYSEVDQFVFHMMDTEFFFPGKGDSSSAPNISYKDQVNNMKSLLDKYAEKLIGFVAFNPNRADGLELVKDAIANGFKGIKFYPPLGYSPIDSMDLFRYCEGNHIPVFTHCTPKGFELYSGAGVFADPKNWEVVLKEVPKLRLCLGHAGGVDGWFEPLEPIAPFKDEHFAKKVVELCQQYENVYAEVGFLDHIEDETERGYFAARLSHLFQDNSQQFNIKDKLMYGSDWHVLMNASGKLYKNYLKEFQELFDDSAFNEVANMEQIKKNFFKGNAKKWLG